MVAEDVKALLADEGVALFQCTGYWQNLVTGDEYGRHEAVRTVQAALRLAGWLGARAIDTGPGSHNPDGPWFPHPANWTADSRHQLVRSLRECAAAAEAAGVLLCLEGHQLVTLESALVMKDVLDQVDSRWVRCDYDSANWVTRETVYESTRALTHDFDVLGDHIVSCHAKDVWLENRLALHLRDGCPGQGHVVFARSSAHGRCRRVPDHRRGNTTGAAGGERALSSDCPGARRAGAGRLSNHAKLRFPRP
jgi:sugar phosphate isomerase/epimerase